MPASIPGPGTLVLIRQRQWRVERAHRDRHILRLDVANRDRRLTFLAPFDRPVFRQAPTRLRRVRVQYARARLAGLLATRRAFSELSVLLDSHVDLLAFQLEPALAVVVDGARRVLIADEVGLGKTIQAAAILAELSRRQPHLRALIITPAVLCDQWAAELEARFGLTAARADREGLSPRRHAAAGTNPWRGAGIWLTSIDYVKQPHVLDAMPLLAWDLVIVDEAHDACGESVRYQACDELVRRARHAVLLTATPHSGDDDRFARLERLGHLQGTADGLTVFRRTRSDVNVCTRRHVSWRLVPLANEEIRLLDTLVSFEQAVLARAGARRDAAMLLLAVFRKRALSTFGAFTKSLERRQSFLEDPEHLPDWYQPRLEFDEDAEASTAEQRALMSDIDLPRAQERAWIRRLRTLATAAVRAESKIARLVTLARRTMAPIVVFTEFRESLAVIEPRLSRVRTVASLHGGQSPDERRRALGRFLAGDASVLLATDVGGQGLNLQHRARWVVSLELPWNPVRLEQRFGRVDRIGQTRATRLTLLVARHPAETTLLLHLARRVLSAQQTFGTGVLGLALPPEHAVGASLFAGRSTAQSPGDRRASLGVQPYASGALIPSQTVAIAHKWRRAARAQTRLLSRKRTLRDLWRSNAPGQERPWITHLRGRASLGTRRIAIVGFPIIDAMGDTVERILIAVRCLDVIPAPMLPHLVEQVVRSRLNARLARVQRLVAKYSSDASRAEAALGVHLHAIGYPEETEIGLFDRRSLRLFEASRTAAETSRAEHRARVDDLSKRVPLSVGSPYLVGLVDLPR